MATLGYNVHGGQPDALDWRNLKLTKAQATENGEINTLRFRTLKYTGSADWLGVVGIYDASTMAPIANSFDGPGPLVQITNTSYHWLTYTYTGTLPVIVKDAWYYIGVAPFGGNNVAMMTRYDVDAGMGGRCNRGDGDFNEVIDIVGGTENDRHSIYVTYTPTGPSLEIEGITPGAIELVDWSNVIDVY